MTSKPQPRPDGQIKRLIINLPPSSSKSRAATFRFPAWLGHKPSAQIICASDGRSAPINSADEEEAVTKR